MSPPSRIYTPNSTSDSDNLVKHGKTKSLPGSPSLSQKNALSKLPIRRFKRGKTVDYVSYHPVLHSRKSSQSSGSNSPVNSRTPQTVSADTDHVGIKARSNYGRLSIDLPTEKGKYKSINKHMVEHDISKSAEDLHLQRRKMYYERDGESLFNERESVTQAEGTCIECGHYSSDVSDVYHSDADDEYEESNSSSIFSGLDVRSSSDRTTFSHLDTVCEAENQNMLNTGMSVLQDTQHIDRINPQDVPRPSMLFPQHTDIFTPQDTPHTGMFIPNQSETAFSFEETEEHKESIITSSNNNKDNLAISRETENCTVSNSLHMMENGDIPVATGCTEDSMLTLYSSGSDELGNLSTSSMSIHGHTDDLMAAKASSSHDVYGACCSGKTLDRSKLKLDIKGCHIHGLQHSLDIAATTVVDSMRAELEEEMSCLENEVEKAIQNKKISPVQSPFLVPLTPQSEAAKILARIGDEVKDQYGSQLDAAMRELFYEEQSSITYHRFKEVAKSVVDDNLPGWRQVALLLVYGQRAAWRAIETGHRSISSVVDNTSHLVADMAADFIIQQGGWGSVMNSSPTSLNSLSITPDDVKHSPSTVHSNLMKSYPWNSEETNDMHSPDLQHSIYNQIIGEDVIAEHCTPCAVNHSCFADDSNLSYQSPSLNVSANNNHTPKSDIDPEYKFTDDTTEDSVADLPAHAVIWSVLQELEQEQDTFWRDVTECYAHILMICGFALYVSYIATH